MNKRGRPEGSFKLEGVRKARQMRAYDEEWELIQAFEKIVKYGDKNAAKEFIKTQKDDSRIDK